MTNLKPAKEFAEKWSGINSLGYSTMPIYPDSDPMRKSQPENTIVKTEGVLHSDSGSQSDSNVSPIDSYDFSDQFDPGPFPVDALSPVMRRIAHTLAQCNQVPIEMAVLGVLGVLSAAPSRSVILRGAVDGKESRSNLFVLVAAPKSMGKSSIAGPLVEPVINFSNKLKEEFLSRVAPSLRAELEMLEYKKKVLLKILDRKSSTLGGVEFRETQEELKEINSEIDLIARKLKSVPTLWAGDVTSEALTAVLEANNDQCFIYSPEAGDLLRVMGGKYNSNGKGDYSIYLSGWSVESANITRVGRGQFTITPCLSMLLFVQPAILREILSNREADERGLIARIILAEFNSQPTEDDGIQREVDPQARRDWNQLVQGLLNDRHAAKGEGDRVLSCSPEAREVFRDYHNEVVRLRRGQLSDVEANLARAREIAVRLALILSLADDPLTREVDEGHARRAVAIGRWCLYSAMKVTAAARNAARDDALQKLVTLIKKKGGRQTLRVLKKDHGYTEQTVVLLVRHSLGQLIIESVQSSGGGRPSLLVRLVSS